MKGPKEGNGDGSKQAGPALFPRLHVAEIKRVGPRAPPRNKMALYEQFTIPSHSHTYSSVPLPSSGRPSVTPCITPVYQPQVQAGSYDSRYSYMPMSYMNPINPAMAYMPIMNVGQYGVGGQVSLNMSSTSTVDGATDSQRVPLAGHTPTHASHSRRSVHGKGGKEDDDFAVPTYSSVTHGSSQTLSSSSALEAQETFRGQRAVQKGWESGKEKQLHTGSNQHRRSRKETSMEDMSVEQNDHTSLRTGSGECITVSITENDVGSGDPDHRGGSDGGCVEHEVSQSETVASESELEDDKGQRDEDGQRDKDSQPSVAATRDASQQVDSLREMPEQGRHGSESSQNQSGEMSEPSQTRRGTSDETESSMLENVPTISPRDVMDALGEQDFWKARKTILRQQKMFSDQVFQLHRIIEVQLLMVKSPNLMFNIDEVEEEEDVPAPASPAAAEVPEVPARVLETNVSKPVNITRPVVETSPPLTPIIYPVPMPRQQGFIPGQPWPASPYGANPWAARMASSYMYVPYPSPYPPAYGMYPPTGSDMAMYDQSGVLQGARFPAWQQSGNFQSWGAQDPKAAAAWYGPQQVPVMAPTGTMGVSEPARNFARVDSSGASSQAQKNTPAKESARQGGECSHVVAERTHKADALESFGWAKGWGRTEGRWERRDRNMLRNKEPVAGAQGGEAHGSGREDPGHERGEQCGDGGNRPVEHGEYGGVRSEWESEKVSPGGSRHGKALEGRASKRIYTEGGVPEPISRFPMFPPRRGLQQSGVIKVVPRAVAATPESTAGILLSIQRDRQR